MPLLYLPILLLFQFLGGFLQQQFGLPVPGAIVGMLLFLGYLSVTPPSPGLEKVSTMLIQRLPLFFIPAGVGLLGYVEEIKRSGLALAMAITIGTLLGFLLSLWLMSRPSFGKR